MLIEFGWYWFFNVNDTPGNLKREYSTLGCIENPTEAVFSLTVHLSSEQHEKCRTFDIFNQFSAHSPYVIPGNFNILDESWQWIRIFPTNYFFFAVKFYFMGFYLLTNINCWKVENCIYLNGAIVNWNNGTFDTEKPFKAQITI